MTSTTADRILAHLARLTRRDDMPPTTGEIADSLGITEQLARTNLKALENLGRVRKLGTSYTGARCWGLADKEN